MKKTKKAIALFLVAALALSTVSFAGCSKKKQETITLDVYSQRANYSGEQIGWFGKVMLDKFNVKLNIINDADDSTFTTRMEAGDLGDIVIFGSDADKYPDAVKNGMLFDWNEDDLLSDCGPYIKEHMQKALEKNVSINEDGKLHGFGYQVATSPEDHASYIYHPDIRWDLYKQLGYPKVGTVEDFVDVLAQMKEICPTSDSGKETYGVSMFDDWDGDSVMMVKSTAALYGFEELGIGLYDVNTQTWQGNLDDGSMYLRFLKFYNDLYQKDLLDPDSMTQKYDGCNEDYMTGGALFNIFNFIASAAYNTDEHLKEGKAMYTCPVEDQNTLVNGLNVYGSNSIWTIGASTQYPELCMEIINWLATPEGKMVSQYGPQGLCWDYDDNKKITLTDLGIRCRNDKDTQMEGDYTGTFSDGSSQMNCITWSDDASNPDSNGETYNYLNWESYNQTLNSDIKNDWRTWSGFTTEDQFLDSRKHSVAVGTPWTQEPRSEELDVIWKQVTKCIKDYSWKAIYAKNNDEFNTIVAEMVKKANDYGYDKCCEFMLDQAAKRKKAEDAVLDK